MIERVEVQGRGGEAELVIKGRFAVPTFDVRMADDGMSAVVEVPGAELPTEGVAQSGHSLLIARTVASTTARGVRVEVKLSKKSRHVATTAPGRIELRFTSEGEMVREAPSHGRAQVLNAHLEKRNGRERVVVELAGEPRFEVEGEGNALSLAIRNVEAGKALAEQLEGLDDGLVSKVRLDRERGRVVLHAQTRQAATGTALRQGNRLIWMFAPVDQGRRRARTVARDPGHESETEDAAGFLTDIPLQVDASRGRRAFSGRRIDLDFKDADIHNILRLLADVGGVNVVTADDVGGTVTIRMRNVPWDQALDVILQAKGLGMVRRGNLIRVAPMATLEKEREAAIARAKQREQLAPIETRLVPVSYAQAEELNPRVKELLSSRGSVSVDARTNMLIVRDIIENIDDIEELVRNLDTQTPQVLVEARIVEATSQYIRDVGIQWGGDVTASTATGNPTGLVFPSNVAVAGGAYDAQAPAQGLSPFVGTVSPPNFLVNLPAVTGTGAGGAIGLTLGSLGGNFNLNVRLSAAESNGVVRIISSPRILTLDNHESHIAQGTLIPYSQVSAQGVQTAFQEAKLELKVRPHVTSDGSVAMHVKVTRDEPDFSRTSARGDPTILKREAETELLIADGNTAVIGGIYTRNTGRNVEQVPFFGEIPILGALFKRRRVRDERNELLIFLTPRIVNREASIGQ